MGFFKTLIRIVTFGIVGKERTAEEVYARKRLAVEKQQQQAAIKKALEEEKAKQLKK